MRKPLRSQFMAMILKFLDNGSFRLGISLFLFLLFFISAFLNISTHINTMPKQIVIRRLTKAEAEQVAKKFREPAFAIGQGRDGHVYADSIEDGTTVVPVVLKIPRLGDKWHVAQRWARILEKLQEVGVPIVPYPQAEGNALIMSDLRSSVYVSELGPATNIATEMDNGRDLAEQLAKQMAQIHSQGYLMDDRNGALAFRAWFLLKDLLNQRHGRTVVTDVGGVVSRDAFLHSHCAVDVDFTLDLNIASLFKLVDFDLGLTEIMYQVYIANLSGRHAHELNTNASRTFQCIRTDDSYLRNIRHKYKSVAEQFALLQRT